jgi:cyclopropane fatty-acyl-phospholipid synthase-like methyltransferase
MGLVEMEKQDVGGYDLGYMPLMDLVWGKGFIAPGGEGNVDRIVRDVDLKGKRVLELGSGAGGGSLVLAGKHGASVVGLELESPLVELSRQLAEEAGLSSQVEYRCVEPGPLPVDDASFDVLYSSGVILHFEDRLALFRDVLRVLKPGGMLLGYDWFVAVLSDDINRWLKAAEIEVFPDRVENYAKTMRDAGFEKVSYEDASDWYLKKAEQELEQLTGPLFEQAAEVSNEALRDIVIDEWQTMNVVLKSGELKSGYFRGRKPE